MLDITRDIHSVTTFPAQTGAIHEAVAETRQPVVLTVKGKAELVIRDAESYQRLLDIAARADVNEAIRQGLLDVHQGRTRPAREVFDEVRRRYGIPR